MSLAPDEVAAWLERCGDDAEFWGSAPSWHAEMALREVEHHLVGLGPTGLLVVPPPGSVLAQFFDGESTLAELAEDLAEAGDAPLEQARLVTAMTTVELHALGVLHGVAAPIRADDTSANEQAGGESSDSEPAPDAVVVSYRTDPETGENLRVESYIDDDGNPVTVEHQPDGTRRVTVEHTYLVGQGDQAATDAGMLAEELMGGRRSVAELVPAGSCLGQKLRIGEDAEVVSICCPDGAVRSVRCDDPNVVDALVARAGSLLAPDGTRGPVEAFVTVPFEGDGPRRVYDGRGERRGRPRTVDQIVDLVDRLIGEATLLGGSSPAGGPLLTATVARRNGEALLVHRSLDSEYHIRQELRRDGWELTGAAATVYEGHELGWATALGDPGRVPFDAVRLGPGFDQLPGPMLLARIVGSGPVNAPFGDAVDRLVDLVTVVANGPATGT